MISPHTVPRAGRVAGAVIGSAVGDALGAPFEFGPAGVFSARFPEGVSTLCGGGGWDPGEATDDTQMAVLVGESLLEQGGLDLPDVFDRFRRWAAGELKDIGLQTEDVLTNGDRAAWEGTAVFHELVRVALAGDDPLAALPETLGEVHADHRPRWAAVLAPDWHPALATEFNGAVWPCLGTALWALRTTDTFEAALAAAVDVGGDTDTVAAVTGGLAGAVYGIDAVPDRWTGLLHVPLPGHGDRVLRTPDLLILAEQLDDKGAHKGQIRAE